MRLDHLLSKEKSKGDCCSIMSVLEIISNREAIDYEFERIMKNMIRNARETL